jgi:hypothetical protein
VNKNPTVLDISPFDSITISPVHTLAALRKSLFKISRRAVRDVFSEPSFSSIVNVLDSRLAIYPRRTFYFVLQIKIKKVTL